MDARTVHELRETILNRIQHILIHSYGQSLDSIDQNNLDAHLAFKGDPQLNELRLALYRMKEGTYGNCIYCKNPISVEILRRSPTAHFCESCAAKLSAHLKRNSMHKTAS